MIFREPRRGGSSLPVRGESLYSLCVETKTTLILGRGGITGGRFGLKRQQPKVPAR